jgi:hypothetical protein
MDIRGYNRAAWDREARRGSEWSTPAPPAQIAAARRGDWQLLPTESRPVPREWLPPLDGLEILCLASGEGSKGQCSRQLL